MKSLYKSHWTEFKISHIRSQLELVVTKFITYTNKSERRSGEY
jgi:hypothetical protein